MPIAYDNSTTALLHPEQQSAELPLPDGRQPSERALAAECARLAYLRAEAPAGPDLQRLTAALARCGLGPPRLFADRQHGGQAFGAHRAADGLAIIAVRGTQPDALEDALTDARIRLVPAPGGAPGLVHAGFLASASGLLPGMRDWLATLPPLPAMRLVVCGHSLGAAVATLLAEPLRARHLLTLGSPRVADAAYGQHLVAMPGLQITRIVDGVDLVTMVPPASGSAVSPVLLKALQAVLAAGLPALAGLAKRLAALQERALPYRHLGRRLYIDRHGNLHDDPDDAFVEQDRREAIATLPPLGLGKVPTRLLSDHAPINYLRSLWPG